MKTYDYNSSRCLDADQATLPTAQGSLFLAISWLSSSISISHKLCWQELLTNLIGKLGFLMLKIFNHNQSNKLATKNPTARVEMVNNSGSAAKVINGNNTQQLQHLIKRTFGKYLAYASNCSLVIDQSSGTSEGNCHNWCLRRCSIISKLAAITGYIKIKNAHARPSFLVNNIITVTIRLVISNFGRSNPEHAIILGSIKKFLSFILVKTLIKIDLLKITQNYLKAY